MAETRAGKGLNTPSLGRWSATVVLSAVSQHAAREFEKFLVGLLRAEQVSAAASHHGGPYRMESRRDKNENRVLDSSMIVPLQKILLHIPRSLIRRNQRLQS
jgi:hypothetical protein